MHFIKRNHKHTRKQSKDVGTGRRYQWIHFVGQNRIRSNQLGKIIWNEISLWEWLRKRYGQARVGGDGTGSLVGHCKGSAWTGGSKSAAGRISVAFWLGSDVLKWADVAICVQSAPEPVSLHKGKIWLYMEYSETQRWLQGENYDLQWKGWHVWTLTKGVWRLKLGCVHKYLAAVRSEKGECSLGVVLR